MKGEWRANHKDSFYVGNFQTDHNSKDGFHPMIVETLEGRE